MKPCVFLLAAVAMSSALAAPDCSSIKPKGTAEELDRELQKGSAQERTAILAMALDYGYAISEPVVLDSLHGSTDTARRMSGYPWLTPAAVAAVLQHPDDEVIAGMLKAGCTSLSPAQIDGLIARQLKRGGRTEDVVLRALLRGDRYAITPDQAKRMGQSSDAMVTLRLNQRFPDGDNLALVRKIVAQRGKDAWSAVRTLASVPPDLVEAMLAHPDPETRRLFVKEGHFLPTADQQERILTDPENSVVIALLGRTDITLTDAQTQRGVQTSDDSLRYWYCQRRELKPGTPQSGRCKAR